MQTKCIDQKSKASEIVFLQNKFSVKLCNYFFCTEEHPPEVKPDLSPPAVKKEEPVIMEVKAQDAAAPVTTAAPPAASSGSGRRKKKQKVEPVVTGELQMEYN